MENSPPSHCDEVWQNEENMIVVSQEMFCQVCDIQRLGSVLLVVLQCEAVEMLQVSIGWATPGLAVS